MLKVLAIIGVAIAILGGLGIAGAVLYVLALIDVNDRGEDSTNEQTTK